MIRHILELVVPFMIWMGMAWFLSDGGKNREDFWYTILLPFFLVGLVGLVTLLSLFFAWLY